MGNRFELIADDALVPLDDYEKCQVCFRTGVPLYEAQGRIVNQDGSVDESKDVYAVCESCLKTGRVAHTSEWQTDRVIERFASDPQAAKALLRRTPRIPLMLQQADWPLCCGQLTEFTGVPKEDEGLANLLSPLIPWINGPIDQETVKEKPWLVRDFEQDGPPESLDEISIFVCRSCGKGYFTDQYT
jgi:hypothetical protein